MRILLVSFFFPPFNSVGAVRPSKLAKHLLRLGHEVEVLTARDQPFPEGLAPEIAPEHVHYTGWFNVNAPVDAILGRNRSDQRGYDAAATGRPCLAMLGAFYRTVVHFPDAQIGWYRAATRAGARLFSSRSFDLVYASAPPFTGLLVASELARRYAVPWVAEFRDLWTDNHAYRFPAARRHVERRLETRTLRSAAGAVTVSEGLAARLAARFSNPVEVIYNGFDPEDVPHGGEERFEPRGLPLLIVYTGSVYAEHYALETFWRALRVLAPAPGEIALRFCGRNLSAAQAGAVRAGLGHLAEFMGTLPRDRALALQRAADVLLFFPWTGPGEAGVYTTKLFEYLGARRPVLGVGRPDSDAGRLIASHRAGHVSQDAESIAQWLRARIAAKRAAGREPDLAGKGLEALTRESQTRRLSAFLERLVGARAELRVGHG